MTEIKKNKKIKYLINLEAILNSFIRIMLIPITLYIHNLYFKNETMIVEWLYLLMSMTIYSIIYFIIYYLIKMLIGNIIKKEFIKINPETKLLKEISKTEIFNIDKYIEENKQKLDLKV